MFSPQKKFGLSTLLLQSAFLWLLSKHGAVSMWCRTVVQPWILFGVGQPPDVRSTVPSVYFWTAEIHMKYKWKILTSLFQGRSWSLRHHSGCARKDKVFCERLFRLYRQQSEKDKQHVVLAPPWDAHDYIVVCIQYSFPKVRLITKSNLWKHFEVFQVIISW